MKEKQYLRQKRWKIFQKLRCNVLDLITLSSGMKRLKWASWVLFLEVLIHQMLIVDTINIYNLQNLMTNLEPVLGTQISLAFWLVNCEI